MFNDWDFSMEGRTSSGSSRMGCMSALAEGHSIIDFICPFDLDRQEYDIRVWMNTIKKGRFDDTNNMFEKPINVDYEIKDYNYNHIINEIKNRL